MVHSDTFVKVNCIRASLRWSSFQQLVPSLQRTSDTRVRVTIAFLVTSLRLSSFLLGYSPMSDSRLWEEPWWFQTFSISHLLSARSPWQRIRNGFLLLPWSIHPHKVLLCRYTEFLGLHSLFFLAWHAGWVVGPSGVCRSKVLYVQLVQFGLSSCSGHIKENQSKQESWFELCFFYLERFKILKTLSLWVIKMFLIKINWKMPCLSILN